MVGAAEGEDPRPQAGHDAGTPYRQNPASMSDQTITPKTVNDLRLDASGEVQRYLIAAYQRGYRWSPLQVTQLLEDTWPC